MNLNMKNSTSCESILSISRKHKRSRTTKRRFRSWKTLLLIGGMAFPVSSPAYAAEPAAAPSSGEHAGSSKASSADAQVEITVTAQKRTTTLQETPLAISAYTGPFLTKFVMTNLQDLSSVAPDLIFVERTGQSAFSIRGITSQDTGSDIGDPAIATATDGVFLNRPFSLSATMYDISRVEVMRGPQGTLYGRNATGGVVNIITNKPSLTEEGEFSLQYGNYGTLNARGMVNFPISDGLQVRAAFASYQHDGYRENAPARDGDDQDAKSGRVTVAFQPTENLHGSVAFEYTHQGGAGQAIRLIPFQYDTDGDLDHSMPTLGSATKWSQTVNSNLSIREKAIRWDLGYDMPFATISYVGGYDVIKYSSTTPSDGDLASSRSWNNTMAPKTQNHDLRISSRNSGICSPPGWVPGGSL